MVVAAATLLLARQASGRSATTCFSGLCIGSLDQRVSGGFPARRNLAFFSAKKKNNNNKNEPSRWNESKALKNEDEDPQEKHEHYQGDHNKVLHELEHRTKHTGIMEAGKLVAEQCVRMAERVTGRAGEQAGERLAERVGKGIVERASEQAGERLVERAGKLAVERTGERLAERARERLVKGTGERLVERTGERFTERAGARVAERAGERIAEQVGEKVGERGIVNAIERTWKKITGRAGRRASELIGERGLERVGERMLERSGERALERTGERATERAVEAGLAAAERRALANSGKKIALRRLGRGALIFIPILGSVFALWIFRADMTRAKEEWERQKSDKVWALFLLAAIADGSDALVHVIIVCALITEAIGHHHLMAVETFSLACAVTSTLFAVGGELMSQRKIRRNSMETNERRTLTK